MKNRFSYAIAIFTSVFLFTSCENDNDKDTDPTSDYTSLLTDYSDNTVIATYAEMKNNSKVFYDNVVKLKTSKTESDINAACESWKSTRAPWERSEAFLFGPAAYNNLDPSLDSWSLDQSQLEQVLAGKQELTANFVRDGLGAVLRGFHSIEYLLFRNGQNRKPNEITARELEYLVAATQVLRDDCITLWALWNGVQSGTLEAEVMDGLGIDVSKPYKFEFANAGKAGSRYTTQRDAVDEILHGIMDIADEVANGKLADPYTTKDVLVVESWHSWNSLTDFKNNIKSIENAYTSSFGGAGSEISISSLVIEKDKDLDTRTKAKIKAAQDALGKIPQPFRNNLNDNVNIPAAMKAINEVFDIFKKEVKPALFN